MPGDEGTRPAPTEDSIIWAGPGDFGQPAAFDAKTGVAAPLLAGFSLALLGVVAQAPASFRWPGATLTVLALVVLMLVACVQFGFRGRAVLYSKSDVDSWGRLSELGSLADQRLRATVQARDMAEWRRWHHRSRLTYNGGIVLLAISVALVLAPPPSYVIGRQLTAAEAGWRWAGFGLALLGAALELWWMAHDELRERSRRSISKHNGEERGARHGK